MSLIPVRFLFRTLYSCPLVPDVPLDEADHLVRLPDKARIAPFAELDSAPRYADFRIGWNVAGIGFSVEVRGRKVPSMCDPLRPTQSDGITLMIDTRGDRTSHRASKTCQQIHLMPSGGGDKKDEPVFASAKIHRALADAPPMDASDVPFRAWTYKDGWRIEAFLGTAALSGFDPEQFPRLGLFYCVRDSERGEQLSGLSAEFPWNEDPSLWHTLELTRDEKKSGRG